MNSIKDAFETHWLFGTTVIVLAVALTLLVAAATGWIVLKAVNLFVTVPIIISWTNTIVVGIAVRIIRSLFRNKEKT